MHNRGGVWAIGWSVLVCVALAACGTTPSEPPPVDPPEVECGVEPSTDVVSPAFFGVEPIPSGSAEELGEVFDLVRELGACVVGVNAVRWDALEPSPPIEGEPSYDWAALDAVALEAQSAGVELQLTLQVSSTWGTIATGGSVGAPGSSPVRTGYLDAFDRFIEALVTRYAGEPGQRWDQLSEPVLAMLMVGNEIEVPGHWSDNGDAAHPATAATYHELLDRVAGVVHAEAPGVDVLRGSTNPAWVFDDGPDAATLATRIAALGPAQAAAFMEFQDVAVEPGRAYDEFGLHTNHGADAVAHAGAWVKDRLPAGIGVVLEDMRSTPVDTPLVERWPDADGDGTDDVLEAIGAGAEDTGLGAAPDEVISFREAQAAVTSQKALLAAASGYTAAFVSTLVDFPASYPIAQWRSTGLVNRITGERRPAFFAYQQVIELVAGTRRVSLEQLDPGAWVATFQGADDPGDTHIAFVWSDTPRVVDVSELVAVPESVSRLPSLPGENDLVPIEDPVAAVQVGSVPVVVIGEQP